VLTGLFPDLSFKSASPGLKKAGVPHFSRRPQRLFKLYGVSVGGPALRGKVLLNFLETVSDLTPLLRQAVKHQPCLQSNREAPSPFTLLRLP